MIDLLHTFALMCGSFFFNLLTLISDLLGLPKTEPTSVFSGDDNNYDKPGVYRHSATCDMVKYPRDCMSSDPEVKQMTCPSKSNMASGTV